VKQISAIVVSINTTMQSSMGEIKQDLTTQLESFFLVLCTKLHIPIDNPYSSSPPHTEGDYSSHPHTLQNHHFQCDDKYFPGHKCKEQNNFMAISEDILEEDEETPSMYESPKSTDITPPSNHPEVEPIISLNSLTAFFAPQTLKLIGYIKHRKVIILVDSGNTHNFIHRHITQENHCYIHVINNFQIMNANGGSMKCGGRCENVHLQIGDYHLKSHMFAIDMGGCDIVLGADWLRTLGPIIMDFKDLTMKFD
jgi:hypothetical protein